MKSGNKLLTIVLLIVGLLLVNYLASSIPFRADLTDGNIYTLSPGTRSLLGKLEEPVVIDFYFSRSANAVPISFKNFGERIEEMLRQYVRASGGRVTLNVIDPKPDTLEEEAALRAGIASRTLPASQVFLGLVATQADKTRNITFIAPEREGFLEYDISQLIHEVQQVERPRLGLLSTITLSPPPQAPMQQQNSPPPQVSAEQWGRTFEIVLVNPIENALPADLDLLVVVHPRNLTARMQYAIDQFALQGGPVLLAVDPASIYSRFQGQSAGLVEAVSPAVSSDLPRLLQAWGVAYDPTKFIGDPESTLNSTGPTGLPEANIAAIRVEKSRGVISEDSQTTAQLSELWFVEAGSLGPLPGATTTFTPLAQTGTRVGEAEASILEVATNTEISRQLSRFGRRTVAALVTGSFRTAFPEGPPPVEAPPEGALGLPPPPPLTGPSLTESTGTSTVVVVADTDWLLDNYSAQRISTIFGTADFVPINDNVAFAANLAEFLGGSQDLISLRGKGSTLRPFEVVQSLRAAANQQYEQRLAQLNDDRERLGEVLSQLQARNEDQFMLVPSPEVEAAMATYRGQLADLSRQEREIRAELREEIDSLERRMLAINLTATPLLVCLFGIWFHRHRRQSVKPAPSR
jgi:ABC-type uncharacterized transport system involved in gliding motility auxiliary subunit